MQLHHTLFTLTASHHFLIAYSGGLDSHVLLHAMIELRKEYPEMMLSAIHVNHHLNPQSTLWAQHCQKICDELAVPLLIENIHIDLKPGDSLEENARDARYAVFKKQLDAKTVLLTAHHLDDQAETFLLQALRGAGSKGLSAMTVKKKCGSSFLIRPLLSYSRSELEKYAHDHHLKWIEDDSNADTKFNRNYLRHAIFPILKKRFPKVMENFSRSARLMAEQEKVISEIAKADLASIHTSTFTHRLPIAPLLQFSESRQRVILREWLHQHHLRMPNEKHLKQIQKDVLNAAPDAHPVFVLGDITLRRVRGELVID